MKIYINNNLRQSADTMGHITQLLTHFYDKREGMTWFYLLTIANNKGENPTQRVQFKEFFSINFTYTIGQK